LVQLAELSVSLNMPVIDCRSQTERRVNLKEEYVHERWAVNRANA